MTRRGLFATIAAAVVGRQLAPAVLLRPGDLLSVTFSSIHAQYGMAIQVSHQLLTDDLLTNAEFDALACELRRREDEVMAEVFRRSA